MKVLMKLDSESEGESESLVEFIPRGNLTQREME